MIETAIFNDAERLKPQVFRMNQPKPDALNINASVTMRLRVLDKDRVTAHCLAVLTRRGRELNYRYPVATLKSCRCVCHHLRHYAASAFRASRSAQRQIRCFHSLCPT